MIKQKDTISTSDNTQSEAELYDETLLCNGSWLEGMCRATFADHKYKRGLQISRDEQASCAAWRQKQACGRDVTAIYFITNIALFAI